MGKKRQDQLKRLFSFKEKPRRERVKNRPRCPEPGLWWCSGCRKWQPPAEFTPSAKKVSEGSRRCAEYWREARKRSYRKHRIRYLEERMLNVEENMFQRMRVACGMRGMELAVATERLLKLLATEPPCPYCGDTLTHANYSLDHKVPISQNGDPGPENIQLTCQVCNPAKHAATEESYVAWHVRLRERTIAAYVASLVPAPVVLPEGRDLTADEAVSGASELPCVP